MGGKSGSKSGKKAAQIQGQTEKEIARSATYADRPDQFNPYTSTTWNQETVIDPATGEEVTKWTQNTDWTPEMAGINRSMMNRVATESDLASSAMNRAREDFAQGPDFDQFGDVQGLEFTGEQYRNMAEDAAYQRATNRLDPQFEADRSSTEARLRNQGLRPGDAAYDAAMETFNRRRNDAYEQARLGATAEGRAEIDGMWGRAVEENQLNNALRDKRIQEYVNKRNYNLGEARDLGASSDALIAKAGGGA